MTSRLIGIAALAASMTVGFGAGMARAEPHVVIVGSSAAVGRTGIWSVGGPILRGAAAETRAALRAVNGDLRAASGDLRAAAGDLRAAGQELRNIGIFYFYGQP